MLVNANMKLFFLRVFIGVSLLCLGTSHTGLADEVGKALIEAVRNKDRTHARQLLDTLNPRDPEARAVLNEVDNEGKSPLIWALEGGLGADLVRILLDKGADVNLADHKGRTPLIYVAQKGQLELMQALLRRGATINHQDKMGWTALSQSLVSASTEQDQFRILNLCVENGAKLDSLFPGDLAAYVNSHHYDGFHDRSILVWAVEANALRLTRYLLSLHPSLHSLEPLLMSAIERGNLEMVKFLAQRGVQLCPKESIHPSGHTPLTLAVEKGKVEIARFILDSVSRSGAGAITQRNVI